MEKETLLSYEDLVKCYKKLVTNKISDEEIFDNLRWVAAYTLADSFDLSTKDIAEMLDGGNIGGIINEIDIAGQFEEYTEEDFIKTLKEFDF